jgi:hypothetical protein
MLAAIGVALMATSATGLSVSHAPIVSGVRAKVGRDVSTPCHILEVTNTFLFDKSANCS